MALLHVLNPGKHLLTAIKKYYNMYYELNRPLDVYLKQYHVTVNYIRQDKYYV